MPKFKDLVRALAYTMLFSAAIHLSSSILLGLFSDYNEANIFRVLGMERFFPSIGNGFDNFVLSWLVGAVIFFSFLFYILDGKKKDR